MLPDLLGARRRHRRARRRAPRARARASALGLGRAVVRRTASPSSHTISTSSPRGRPCATAGASPATASAALRNGNEHASAHRPTSSLRATRGVCVRPQSAQAVRAGRRAPDGRAARDRSWRRREAHRPVTTKTRRSRVGRFERAHAARRTPRRAAAREVARRAPRAPDVVERRADDLAGRVGDDGCLHLVGDVGEVGERVHPSHVHRPASRHPARGPGACAAQTAARPEVLRRPRPTPRGDDRVLRAARVRAADVPRALAARRSPGARTSRASSCARSARFPGDADRGHRRASSARAGQRRDARHRRRCLPALDGALAVQRARVGLQHRLRPSEPPLRPREVLALVLMVGSLRRSS